MRTLLPFLFQLLAVGGAITALLYRRRSLYRRWKALADTLGLPFERPGFLSDYSLSGPVGGFPAQIVRKTAKNSSWVEMELNVASLGLGDVVVSKRIFPRLLTGGGVGDEEFDEVFKVDGDEVLSTAALSPSVRSTFVGLRKLEIDLDFGTLKARVNGPKDVPQAMQQLLALARALDVRPPGGRLRANLREELLLAPARRAFALALKVTPEADRAALVEEALAHPLGPVRLDACAHTDAPRRAKMLEALLAGTTLPDADRARAIWAWADLVQPRPKQIAALIPGSGPLAKAAALTALGEHGAGSQEPLIEALGDEELEVRLAAVDALSRIGGRDAVAPLMEASRGLLTSGELKERAARAIQAIQARLGGAEAGRLALADDTGEGRLGLVGAEGALSKTERDGD